MSEPTMSERTTEQATTPAAEHVPASEVTAQTPKPIQDATPKPRIPRAQCAC